MKKELIRIKVADLIPYDNNPRIITQEAIDDVRESYRQCGVIDPIEIDEDNVILCGHTRRLAAMEDGIEEVDALRVSGLTKAQKRKYRILANKTGEKSVWDYPKLNLELEDLDFEGYDFDFGDYAVDTGDDEYTEPDEDNKYTFKVNIPQYEPEGPCPAIEEMVDVEKYNSLISEIEKSDIPDDAKGFLKLAAARHIGFNYKIIANFYAHQSPRIQKLMEDSALVIIDVDDAIRNGYAKLSKVIDDMTEGDDEDEE